MKTALQIAKELKENTKIDRLTFLKQKKKQYHDFAVEQMIVFDNMKGERSCFSLFGTCCKKKGFIKFEIDKKTDCLMLEFISSGIFYYNKETIFWTHAEIQEDGEIKYNVIYDGMHQDYNLAVDDYGFSESVLLNKDEFVKKLGKVMARFIV